MSFHFTRGYERGGFAPRRGRGRGGARPFVKRTVVKPDIVKHPLGQLLQTFKLSDLQSLTDRAVDSDTITNCEYVASYNWTDAKTPTILVPGK